MKRLLSPFLLGIAILAALGLTSCGDDEGAPPPSESPGEEGGPIDGRYRLSSARCDTQTVDLTQAQTSLTIQDTLIETSITLPNAVCTITQRGAASYPRSGEVRISDVATTCTPNDCDDVCSEPSNGDDTLNYTVNGDSLQVEIDDSEISDFCPSGTINAILIWKKQ